MPYDPGITYRGDQYLFQGITGGTKSAIEGWLKGKEEREKAEAEEKANSLVLDFAQRNKLISDEQVSKFVSGNKNAKRGIIAGLVQTLAIDAQQQGIQNQQRDYDLRMKEYERRLAQDEGPSEEERRAAQEQARWAGKELIYPGPGMNAVLADYPSGKDQGPTPEQQRAAQEQARWAGAELIYPGPGISPVVVNYPENAGATGGIKILPFKDPTTNEVVPNINIVQGPGKQFQIVHRGSGQPVEVKTDQTTGMQYFEEVDNNGDVKVHWFTEGQLREGKRNLAIREAKKQEEEAEAKRTGKPVPTATPSPTPGAAGTPSSIKAGAVEGASHQVPVFDRKTGKSGFIPIENVFNARKATLEDGTQRFDFGY